MKLNDVKFACVDSIIVGLVRLARLYLLRARVKYDLCMILLTNCGQIYSHIGSSLDVADVASDQVCNSYTCYQLIFRLLLQYYK